MEDLHLFSSNFSVESREEPSSLDMCHSNSIDLDGRRIIDSISQRSHGWLKKTLTRSLSKKHISDLSDRVKEPLKQWSSLIETFLISQSIADETSQESNGQRLFDISYQILSGNQNIRLFSLRVTPNGDLAPTNAEENLKKQFLQDGLTKEQIELKLIKRSKPLPFSSQPLLIKTEGDHFLEGLHLTSDRERYIAAKIEPAKRKTILISSGSHRSFQHYTLGISWALTKMGHDVILYNPSGFGQSGGKPSTEQLQHDILHVFSYMTHELHIPKENIVGYGFSLGGATNGFLAEKLAEEDGLHLPLIQHHTFESAKQAAKAHLKGKKAPLAPLAGHLTEKFIQMNTARRLDQLTSNSLLFIGATDDQISSLAPKAKKKMAKMNQKPPWEVHMVENSLHEAIHLGELVSNLSEEYQLWLEKPSGAERAFTFFRSLPNAVEPTNDHTGDRISP